MWVLLSVGLALPAAATPLYPSCPVPGNDLAWFSWQWDGSCLCFNSSPVIHIYVESDFAAEMEDCNENLNITQNDLLSVVDAAVETWNSGGRGAYLKVEGNLNVSDEEAFCNATVESPAVLLQFKKTCRDDNDSLKRITGGNATTFGLTACGNRAQMTFWGNRQDGGDSVGTCDLPPFDEPRIFKLGSQFDKNDAGIGFQELLTHELGHVLNIADIAEAPSYTSNTLMNSALDTKDDPDVGRHLFPFDRDCIDENTGDRRAEYHWGEYNSFNNVWAAPYASAVWTRRGTVSGGHTRLGGNSAAWGIYTQNVTTGSPGIRWDTISYGYSAPWNLSWSASGLYPSTVDNLHISPVMTSLQEFGTSGNHSSRMSYAKYETAFTGGFEANIAVMDPPRWSYLRSDTFFGSSGTTTGTWYHCLNSACSSSSTLQGHLPLTSAYDPATDTTVFARIDTGRNSATHGRVKVHPGLSGSTNNFLAHGSWKPVGSLPNSQSQYPHDGTTDTGVGLACAKPGTGVVANNCMLVWVDRGSLNNQILYRYFRLNPAYSGGIEWSSGTYRRDGAFSASNVSAAYFDQKFWLTYRSNAGDVVVMSHPSTSYGSGWTEFTISTSAVVDPPTFVYDADVDTFVNALVVWTEHP